MSRHDAYVVFNLVAGWDSTNHPERVGQADDEKARILAVALADEQALRPIVDRLAKMERAVDELRRQVGGY